MWVWVCGCGCGCVGVGGSGGVRLYVFACMCCIHEHVRFQIHVCGECFTMMSLYMRVCVRICMHVHVRLCVLIYICEHTYSHISSCKCVTHTYLCELLWAGAACCRSNILRVPNSTLAFKLVVLGIFRGCLILLIRRLNVDQDL